MSAAPFPLNEDERMQSLRALGVLGMGRDHGLDALAHRALSMFPGTDSAAISLVASDRQFFQARAGRDWRQTLRSQSFCAHAILQHGVLVVEDAWLDERFVDNPLVTGHPGIRFYAGAPLKDGVGALCVVGLEPRRVIPTEIEALITLARTVGHRLALHSAIRALTRDIPLG